MRRPPDTVNPQIWRVSEDWSLELPSAQRAECKQRGLFPEGAGRAVREAVRSRAFFSAELGDKDLWLSVLNNKALFTEAKGGSGRRFPTPGGGGEEKNNCWVSFSQSKLHQTPPPKKNYRKRNKYFSFLLARTPTQGTRS